MRRLLGPALALLLASSAPLAAQDSLLAELGRRFKSTPLSLGALLQVVGDYQHEGRAGGVNGFRVTNFRLRLSGELDHGFGYLLQTNFVASPAILDAELHLRLGPGLVLQAGQFKAPFSRELLTGAGDLDFIDRARLVTALAPGRQLGAEVRGRVVGRLDYAVGAFNGNGIGNGANDDDRILGVARVGWWLLGGERDAARRLEIAVSGARGEDAAVNLGLLGQGFAGTRTVWGVDLRYEDARWLAAAEAIGARLEPSDGSPTTTPHGWQATGGVRVSRVVQVLARWDAVRGDGRAADSDLLILGVRAWPTGAVQLRVNDAIDLGSAEPGRHRLLAGAQLAF